MTSHPVLHARDRDATSPIAGHPPEIGLNTRSAGGTLIMVRAAKCMACGGEVPRGFHAIGRDFSYLFPFVIDAQWTATSQTVCDCGAEREFVFATEPYCDPYAEMAGAA